MVEDRMGIEGRPGRLDGQLERAAGHLDDVAREREVVAQESLVAHNAVGPDDSRLAGDTLLQCHAQRGDAGFRKPDAVRSEEHTSELQSLMRIAYTVFRLKKKKKNK